MQMASSSRAETNSQSADQLFIKQNLRLITVRSKYAIFYDDLRSNANSIGQFVNCTWSFWKFDNILFFELRVDRSTFVFETIYQQAENMSWITKAGRFLSFMWKSGTTEIQDLDENIVQNAMKSAIDSLKNSYSKLANAKKQLWGSNHV